MSCVSTKRITHLHMWWVNLFLKNPFWVHFSFSWFLPLPPHHIELEESDENRMFQSCPNLPATTDPRQHASFHAKQTDLYIAFTQSALQCASQSHPDASELHAKHCSNHWEQFDMSGYYKSERKPRKESCGGLYFLNVELLHCQTYSKCVYLNVNSV